MSLKKSDEISAKEALKTTVLGTDTHWNSFKERARQMVEQL